MPHLTHRRQRTSFLLITVILAGCAIASQFSGRAFLAGTVSTYLLLMLVPGLLIHLGLDRKSRLLELVLSSIAISPIVVGGVVALCMLAGTAAGIAVKWITVTVALSAVGTVGLYRRVELDEMLSGKKLLLLAATITLFAGLAGYLPLTHETWRYWTDGWFHGAVVSQIGTYGIPPEDPYFAGFQLQYMWFYHVVVISLASAARMDYMVVMPLLNIQALVVFALASFLLSTLFKKGFLYGWFAVLTAICGLNAVVWLFLPVKLGKAFIGDVRGWAEITRTFSLIPFDHNSVWRFLTVYQNPAFLLNKFVVSTAFSLGLGYMAMFCYTGIAYLTQPKKFLLVGAVFAVLGMLLFHPLVGFVLISGFLGGMGFLFLLRHRLKDYSTLRLVKLASMWGVAILLAAPYLYSVMHLKESEQLLPVSISLEKSLSIAITCALTFFLFVKHIPRLAADRRTGPYALLFACIATFIVCNIIVLPGLNTYDKLPFFSFYLTAIVGSWTFADYLKRKHASRGYRLRVLTISLLLLLPVNVLAISAYFNTQHENRIDATEEIASAWVRENTERSAVFIEAGDKAILLNTGPRRYYYGQESYAVGWGYDKEEMENRRHLRSNLYSESPLDKLSLSLLGAMREDTYVIVRNGELPKADKLDQYPRFLDKAYDAESISIYKVNRAACREAALELSHH